MNQLKSKHVSKLRGAHWAWLLPILALAPLSLAAKGCNSAVVGDDCPSGGDCTTVGTGGKGSTPPDPNAKLCGGLQGASCAADQFCSFAASAQCGAADQTGVCKDKPELCTEIYAPVCGCDDMTYSSDCVANGAGVSVARQGECGSNGSGGGSNGSGGGSGSGGATGGGKTCGGLQGLGCGADQYCNFPTAAQCGAGDRTGTCAPKPDACDKSLVPVCGCDDKTYGNACEAASAGISVAHAGECNVVAPGEACGTRGTGTCPQGQYCLFLPAADCGRSDAGGTCTNLPPKNSACPAIYAPVCGCDGKTYGNNCDVAGAGVSIDHEGECGTGTGGTCGGLLGLQCETGFFCNFPLATQCGSGDQTGACTEVPGACDLSFAPVCGCDGKDYGNACAANAAGTSVAAQGTCK